MLFEPFTLGDLQLSNRTVMAPLTRSRAVSDNKANALMAEYYGQRATAGLIVSEGTSPSPNGLGYPRIPGLYNEAQVEGWRLVTDAVHARGGRIFVQLMHTGRVTHRLNLPARARVLGPGAETCPGEMWTDQSGLQAHSQPTPMTRADIANVTAEYANAATLAIKAGFDGIELHAANGYLLEQFLNANVNRRIDAYGGDAAGRNRLTIEVAQATITAIGAARVGIRLSPFGVFNATGAYAGMEEQYLVLARQLSSLGLVYLHLVDHSAMGAPPLPTEFKSQLRSAFAGCFIASGGFDRDRAELALREGRADLIAFGRPFLANPDLVDRLQANVPLNEPDADTFYTAGAKGYTDYPVRPRGD